MTTKQLLDAYDFVLRVRTQLKSGAVACVLRKQTHHVIGYLDRTPFQIVVEVCVGPRGGVHGKVILVDTRIEPATDAVQFSELHDLSTDSFCPLSKLCWRADRHRVPSVEQLSTFLLQHLPRVPTNISKLEIRFRDLSITAPVRSISALPGGATGLRK